MAERIRHRIARCLNNDLHPDKLTSDEQSYLSFFIYKAAYRLVREPESEKEMPSNLLPMIKERAKSLQSKQ